MNPNGFVTGPICSGLQISLETRAKTCYRTDLVVMLPSLVGSVSGEDERPFGTYIKVMRSPNDCGPDGSERNGLHAQGQIVVNPEGGDLAKRGSGQASHGGRKWAVINQHQVLEATSAVGKRDVLDRSEGRIATVT